MTNPAAKFTRRHLTAKVMLSTLAAMKEAAGDLAHGESFELTESGQYAWIKLQGTDTHGPVRCGLANDPQEFEACRAAESVLRSNLAHFSNLEISNHGRSFLLNFSGVVRSQSSIENRD